MPQSLAGKGRQNWFATVPADSLALTLVAAVPNKKIRVVGFTLSHGAAPSTVLFGSGSTSISPVYHEAAASNFSPGENPGGWFETFVGEALTVSTGTGSNTGVLVTYELMAP